MTNSNLSKHERNKRKLRRLMKKGKHRCALCGLGIDMASASLDHIVPKSRGGRNEIFNLRAAHKKCNSSRGNVISPDDPHFQEAYAIHRMAGFL